MKLASGDQSANGKRRMPSLSEFFSDLYSGGGTLCFIILRMSVKIFKVGRFCKVRRSFQEIKSIARGPRIGRVIRTGPINQH